jgi:integrase
MSANYDGRRTLPVQYDYIFERITKSGLSKRNKLIARKFLRYCIADGIRFLTMQRNIDYLVKLDKLLPCDFDRLTKARAETLWAQINSMEEFSDWTKYTFRSGIHKFYRWMETVAEKDYIKMFALKNKMPKTTITPADLLSREEIRAIITNAVDDEMQTIYCILYETGARINEVLALRPRDIEFDDKGALLTLRDKKTGVTRIVRVVDIATVLKVYLGARPGAEKLFWKCYNMYHRLHCLTLAKAGITRKVKFHLFRHTRASYLGQHLPEQLVKQYMGWTPNSRMFSVYIHLSQKNVNDAVVEMHKKNGTGIPF